MTLEELKAEYLIMKQDLSDVENATFILWCNYVSRRWHERLGKVDPEQIISTQSYTITSSPSAQADPVDFATLNAEGCGFFRVNSAGETTSEELLKTGVGSPNKGYFWSGGSFNFTHVTGETYLLRYLPIHTEYTAIGDTFIIPDRFSLYTVRALDVIYAYWDDDLNTTGAESLSGQRLINEIDVVLSEIPTDSRVAVLPDISSFY